MTNRRFILQFGISLLIIWLCTVRGTEGDVIWMATPLIRWYQSIFKITKWMACIDDIILQCHWPTGQSLNSKGWTNNNMMSLVDRLVKHWNFYYTCSICCLWYVHSFLQFSRIFYFVRKCAIKWPLLRLCHTTGDASKTNHFQLSPAIWTSPSFNNHLPSFSFPNLQWQELLS